MASEEQKQLANAIKPLMKNAGFTKTKFNWHKKVGTVVQVFNLQGSQWSKSMYVNIGVYFLDLGNKEKPLERDCHIRERLTKITDDLARCNDLCDFENAIPDFERYMELIELIRDHALPWLDRCSTKEGAKIYLQGSEKQGVAVRTSAMKYLGLLNS